MPLPVLQTSNEHHRKPAIDGPLDRQTATCGEPKQLQNKETSPFEVCEQAARATEHHARSGDVDLAQNAKI